MRPQRIAIALTGPALLALVVGTLWMIVRPTAAAPLTRVAAVAPGGYHTCALTDAGAVKCWGGNDLGQVGDFTQTDRSKPVQGIGLESGVTAIASGYAHSCA